MKQRFLFTALLISAISAWASPIPSGRWSIDPERSSVGFTVTKLASELVEGRFHDFEGQVQYDPSHPELSLVQWRVRVGSIKTGATRRDQRLQSSDFFDAARFPEMSFVSRNIHFLPDGRLLIRGEITIRDQTRPLVITAHSVSLDPAAPVFETDFTLDRLDFGVSPGNPWDMAIGRRVDVHLLVAGALR
jgi:polyisoprenoid-binding protein YceI